MQKTSHTARAEQASKSSQPGGRKAITVKGAVVQHLDKYLVHAQKKDVDNGKPTGNNTDYYTAAMAAGMKANGYPLPEKEKEVDHV